MAKRFAALLSLGLASLVNSCSINPSFSSPPSVVFYGEKVVNNINFLYDNITGVFPNIEFAYCGRGLVRNDTLYVLDGHLPYIDQSNGTEIYYRRCDDEDLVIMLHSHLVAEDRPCGLSVVDVRTALTDDDDMFYGVVCDDEIATWNVGVLRGLVLNDSIVLRKVVGNGSIER